MSPKGPPLSFLLFCYRMRVYKSKRVPPFTFFGTVRHFPKEIFFEIFKFFPKKNVLRFLSLRYSADLRRSRLVFTSIKLFNFLNCFPHDFLFSLTKVKTSGVVLGLFFSEAFCGFVFFSEAFLYPFYRFSFIIGFSLLIVLFRCFLPVSAIMYLKINIDSDESSVLKLEEVPSSVIGVLFLVNNVR